MLSSEFNVEMGALIRRLESRVRLEPKRRGTTPDDPLEKIEQAIVSLIALYFELQKISE
jgi:hypothetical protein